MNGLAEDAGIEDGPGSKRSFTLRERRSLTGEGASSLHRWAGSRSKITVASQRAIAAGRVMGIAREDQRTTPRPIEPSSMASRTPAVASRAFVQTFAARDGIVERRATIALDGSEPRSALQTSVGTC